MSDYSLDYRIMDHLNNNNVTLIINNERYKCDKSALQHASLYFQAMFNSSMLESTAEEIPIHDVDPSVFKVLLDFAETGYLSTSLSSDFNSICEVLKSACIFQFDDVSKKCSTFLASTMDVSNCFKIWELADFLNLADLRFKAKCHALYQGDHVLHSEEILNTCFDIFLELISDNSLNVKTEMNVFNTVVKYIKDNELDETKTKLLVSEIRIQDFEEYEKNIFCPHYVQEHLRSSPESLKKGTKICKNKICNHFTPSQLQTCPSHNNEFRHSSKSRSIPLKPLFYGYSFQGRKNKLKVHLYIQRNTSFEEVASICVHFKNLVGFGVCVVGTDVYIFGGREKAHYGKWNQQMWKYDTLKNSWTELPPITFFRRHFSCIVLEKKIYIVGGLGEHRDVVQSSMMNYDTETGVWTENASPPNSSSLPVVAAALYNRTPSLFFFSTCIYRFVPKENVWQEFVKSHVVSGIQQAITYGDEIYLMTQDLYGNGITILIFDKITAEVRIIGTSLSEDCNNFTILDKKAYVYTDNGIEVMTLPAFLDNGCDQFMFKWKNGQNKFQSAPPKYVGLLPFY